MDFGQALVKWQIFSNRIISLKKIFVQMWQTTSQMKPQMFWIALKGIVDEKGIIGRNVLTR